VQPMQVQPVDPPEVVLQKIQQRAMNMNNGIFLDRQIESQAIEALATLGVAKAFDLFKDLEQKGGSIKNPTKYLLTAAARAGYAGYKPESSTFDYNQIVLRAMKLNQGVFVDKKIDADTIVMMTKIGVTVAEELFAEVERIADLVANPAEYLRTAAETGGHVPPMPPGGLIQSPFPQQRQMGGGGGGGAQKVYKSANLCGDFKNGNCLRGETCRFTHGEQLNPMLNARSMSQFGQLEQQQQQSKGQHQMGQQQMGQQQMGQQQLAIQQGVPMPQEALSDQQKLKKKAAWLNVNLFADRTIDAEAVLAMLDLPFPRAAEIFQELEINGAQVSDPSSYIKASVANAQAQGMQMQPPAPSAEEPDLKRARKSRFSD